MPESVQSEQSCDPGRPVAPYIICVDLLDQQVCVVGGGNVAARKVDALLEAGAKVHIIAQDLCETLRNHLANQALVGRLSWHEGPYQRNLPAGVRLVIACTDDRQVNRRVHSDCRIANVLCNVVDDPELCDFLVPAVRKLGRVQIAVSTGGSSPSLARELADHLAGQVPPAVPDLAHLLAEIRLEVQAQILDTGRRKELFDVLTGSESLRILQESGKDGWREWYQQQLAQRRG